VAGIDWKKPQPAPLALWRLIHVNFPQARNDGIYNDRKIAGKEKKSLHAEGRALDIGLLATRPIEKYIGDRLFDAFTRRAADMGLQEVIWNRQVWTVERPRVHRYQGVDSHTTHIHVGFTCDGSQKSSFGSLLLIRIGEIRTGLEDLYSTA
jgi:hypothetical protein